MEPLLPEDEWTKNVGSESYPVSFRHEYAVGLIWDLLHTQKGPVPWIGASKAPDINRGFCLPSHIPTRWRS
jgi:hypothetical protein